MGEVQGKEEPKVQPKEELIIHPPKVMNLSTVSLTPSEIRTLSKDLKFTLTPPRNLQEMEKDIKDFTKKLRLAEFFTENSELDFYKKKASTRKYFKKVQHFKAQMTRYFNFEKE